MRYLVLIAVLVALPLNASAQQRRSADRQADQNRSERRQSNERQSNDRQGERRSDDRRSDGRKSDDRRSAGQKPPNAAQLPWWERQQKPWWEQKQMPAWEINRIPGYAQGNVARAMLDQQRHQAPVTNHRRQRYYQPSVIYVLPTYRYFEESIVTTAQYGAAPPPPAVTVHADPEPPLPAMGALRLEVEPKEALQIYVDGVYVGTPADLGDELELTPGTRRIELRASGYRSQAFSAEIVDGRSITYRGSLEGVRPSASPAPPSEPASPVTAAPPAGSKVMYMIPGCYLGNVSPKNVTLPAGCDISKLMTITP